MSVCRLTCTVTLSMLLLAFTGGHISWGNPGSQASHSGPVFVGVRYDDYCGAPVSGPDTRLVTERELFDVFHRVGLVPTVSVIPNASTYDGEKIAPWESATNQDRIKLIKQLLANNQIEVAMHGYTHEYLVQQPLPSEFAGLPAQAQRQRIQVGKAIMEEALGVDIHIFVPPNNTYDVATLNVLAEGGFSIISGHCAHGASCREDLLYAPVSCQWWELEATVKNACQYPGPTIVISMLHPFEVKHDGASDKPTVGEIEATLMRIKRIPGVKFTNIGQIAAQSPDLVAASHLEASARLHRLFQSPSLGGILKSAMGGRTRWAYWPESVYRRGAWILWLPYVAGIVIGVIAGLIIGWWTGGWRTGRWAVAGIILLGSVWWAVESKLCSISLASAGYGAGPRIQFAITALLAAAFVLLMYLSMGIIKPKDSDRETNSAA